MAMKEIKRFSMETYKEVLNKIKKGAQHWWPLPCWAALNPAVWTTAKRILPLLKIEFTGTLHPKCGWLHFVCRRTV